MRSAVVDLPAQPIRDLHVNPSFEGPTPPVINAGGVGSGFSTAQKHTGTRSFYVTCTSTNWGYWNYSAIVRPGTTYTWAILVYSEAAQTLWLQNYGAPGLTGPPVAVPAGVWTRLTLTQTMPATIGTVYISVRRQDNATPTPFYVEEFMACAVTAAPDYADGDTPGWRWTGTAHASESVGYPYTLDSIVGARVYEAEDVPASTTPVYSIAAFPHTILVVQSAAANSSDGMWDTRLNAGTQWRRMINGTAASWQVRIDVNKADNTLQVAFSTALTSDTTKLHAYACRSDAAGLYVLADNSVASCLPATPMVWDGKTMPLRVGSRDSTVYPGTVTKYVGVVPRALDDTTMKRALGWLGRKYGVPYPTGFLRDPRPSPKPIPTPEPK